MAEKEKKKNVLVPILIVILVVVIAAGAIVILKLLNKEDDGPNYTSENGIGYEGNAVVLTSGEAAVEQPEGVAVTMQTVATSTDGINFNCKIGNPLANKYDMYVAIYENLDSDTEEPIYLSGLFPPGQGLTTFETNKKLPSGTHEVVLVLTLVEEDHQTLTRQSNVFLNLVVS